MTDDQIRSAFGEWHDCGNVSAEDAYLAGFRLAEQLALESRNAADNPFQRVLDNLRRPFA